MNRSKLKELHFPHNLKTNYLYNKLKKAFDQIWMINHLKYL